MRIPNYVALYDVAHDHLLNSAFQESSSAPRQAVEYSNMSHAYQCIYRGEH